MGGYLVDGKQLVWSGWRCCWVTLSATVAIQIPVWPPLALFICSRLQTPAPEILFVEKNDWLKNRSIFITENFLGILNRLCAEPMRRSHDFLSLTLAIIRSTSDRCYFLQQCRCLSVCVLCVLVVWCVKRFNVFYYNIYNTNSASLAKVIFTKIKRIIPKSLFQANEVFYTHQYFIWVDFWLMQPCSVSSFSLYI